MNVTVTLLLTQSGGNRGSDRTIETHLLANNSHTAKTSKSTHSLIWLYAFSLPSKPSDQELLSHQTTKSRLFRLHQLPHTTKVHQSPFKTTSNSERYVSSYSSSPFSAPLISQSTQFPKSTQTMDLNEMIVNANMGLTEMMLSAVCVHFFRDPNNVGWLLVLYCLYYDIRGIRSWLMSLAVEYLDGVV
jgi:hypothetical protein